MLAKDGRNEWLTILAVGALLTLALGVMGWWVLVALVILATVALLLFFRDPERRPPVQRNIMVAPADGRVSSIHELDHFEPLNGPATCIRIFLSVLDVHVNRAPCHGQVASVVHKDGEHRNALNPDSAEANENNLIVLLHPIRRHPIAAVRQVAGLLARTIACGVQEGDIVQRGQRIGMIKLGSTTELYIPADLGPQPMVQVGQKVKGGVTVLAQIANRDSTESPPASHEAVSAPDSAPAPAPDPAPASDVSSSAAADETAETTDPSEATETTSSVRPVE